MTEAPGLPDGPKAAARLMLARCLSAVFLHHGVSSRFPAAIASSQILASFLEESGNTLDELKNGLFHKYVDSCSADRTQPDPIHVRLIHTLDSSGQSSLSGAEARKLLADER